ncbi:hypothetical protein GOC18_24080 [Sinorhizobium meliloti]|nr:hypothetical protein [Sinorhizobium meliloti]
MASLTQSDRDAIRNVLTNGSSYTVTIAEADIPMNEESKEALAEQLNSGFEMRPSTIIYSDHEATQILARCDDWTAIQVMTYRAGGKIVSESSIRPVWPSSRSEVFHGEDRDSEHDGGTYEGGAKRKSFPLWCRRTNPLRGRAPAVEAEINNRSSRMH